MAVEARYFLDGQGFSARFADFVPQEMKYVALIAACPSEAGTEREEHEAASCCKIGRRHDKAQCFQGLERKARLRYNDKLSRSK